MKISNFVLLTFFAICLFGVEVCAGSEDYCFAPVYFRYNSADLTVSAMKQLAALSSVLKKQPALTVTLTGQCGDCGSSEYALSIGEKMAKSARSYIVSSGVSPERLTVTSRNVQRSANNKVNRRNRRVDIAVIESQ